MGVGVGPAWGRRHERAEDDGGKEGDHLLLTPQAGAGMGSEAPLTWGLGRLQGEWTCEREETSLLCPFAPSPTPAVLCLTLNPGISAIPAAGQAFAGLGPRHGETQLPVPLPCRQGLGHRRGPDWDYLELLSGYCTLPSPERPPPCPRPIELSEEKVTVSCGSHSLGTELLPGSGPHVTPSDRRENQGFSVPLCRREGSEIGHQGQIPNL